jgi:DNA-binding response OmpR family regulator
MATTHVLVIEDDPPLADFLNRALADEGMDPTRCGTMAEAIELASKRPFDVIVLDWMLPDGDGLSVCATLRERGNTTPILMLTARGEVVDRVTGLKSGADDYLVKPFELDELVARIDALVRRSALASVIKMGELEIDRLGRRVGIAGTPLDLTGIEYRLLVRLVNAAGTPVDRAALLQDVWGLRFDPGSGVLEVHISRLRDKLGDSSWMIETVRGKGYRFRSDPPAKAAR